MFVGRGQLQAGRHPANFGQSCIDHPQPWKEAEFAWQSRRCSLGGAV